MAEDVFQDPMTSNQSRALKTRNDGGQSNLTSQDTDENGTDTEKLYTKLDKCGTPTSQETTVNQSQDIPYPGIVVGKATTNTIQYGVLCMGSITINHHA